MLEQFQHLPSEIQRNSSKLFQQLQQYLPSVPAATRDVLASLGNLSEGHKRIVNLFLASETPDEVLSYEEIGQRLTLSPLTVRGYVADLRRLGFPFQERAGRKILIGVRERALETILRRQESAQWEKQTRRHSIPQCSVALVEYGKRVRLESFRCLVG